jgi:hypothetical protein
MPRTIAAILLIALVVIGGGLIAATAYQAGLGTAVTTAVAEGGGTVVAPIAPYGYGYGFGWHPGGFGFFGFLGLLLFLFLVFALIRAVFWRGGPGRGWAGPGPWGNGDHDHARRNFWESRFGENFEEWHRRAHGESSNEPPPPNTPTKPA